MERNPLGRKQGIFARTGSTILRLGLISAALLAGIFRPVQAQNSSIRFETLSVENGLSQGIVRAIMQDEQGYMWFGTEDGLNRYDGYSVTVYKHDPQLLTSISDSTIYTIYQDSQGDLWFGTASGLDQWIPNQEIFKNYLPNVESPTSLSGKGVTAIVEDREGNLWIGTTNHGLNRLDPDTGLFSHFFHQSEHANSLVSNQITALAVDQRGGLWIGTEAGLDYFNPQTETFSHFLNSPEDAQSISSDHITALFQDRFGILWIGTEDNGLNQYNPATRSFSRFLPDSRNSRSIASHFIRSIHEDKNGQLWIGGRNGLDLYNRETNSFQRNQRIAGDPHSLSNDYVLSIFADRTGVLWVGTYGGGVNKYVRANERFTLTQQQPSIAFSLGNDIINAIYEDDAGVVWVGTLDSGLRRLNPETSAFISLNHDPADLSSLGSDDVRAIIKDRENVLWIGTYGGGLNRYDQDTGRFSRYIQNSNNPNSISNSQVTALLEDREGNLWIGTRGGGLDLFDQDTNRFIHFRFAEDDAYSIGSDSIQTIYEDQEGRLWIGTYEGISVMDPQSRRFTRYQHHPGDPTSLSSNRVMSFYEAPDGTMWIGTLLAGLNRFDRSTQTFKHYTQEDGLPNNTIYGILSDPSGYLWMSTNWGLSRFDPQTENFRNYDRRDGLQSNEFSAGAFFQNNQGWMYFGGVQGFIVFDPSRVQDNPVPPPVVITAFKKFNQPQPIDLTGEVPIKLSYQENFISFEFAALDYTAPEKNKYAYKLEGFDKDWIESGTRNYASYTNLGGGSYVFHVIGSNPDGVWNENGTQLLIEVVPPIWERWWFIGSGVLILAGSAFVAYRLRIMRVQAQNRALENQVSERTQEIQRRRQVAEGLREILVILNGNHSLKESLDEIILQITRVLETRGAIIFRCGLDGSLIVLASNLFENGALSSANRISSIPEWIITPVMQGSTLTISDLKDFSKQHPILSSNFFGKYQSLLAVPLVINDLVSGGLVLLYNYPRELVAEDEQIAVNFADHAALAIANAELRSQAEEIAVSAERSRLARDLHDAVTQTLFATSLIAEVLPRLWERNPEVGKQKIEEIRELTRGALAEMRTLLMELRPSSLEDVPLPDLLQQLAEAFIGRARIPIECEICSTIELPSPVKIGFYRIAQEALNNIQKHSKATKAAIQLNEENKYVSLSISDNGIGFEAGSSLPDHFGLRIMEERAQNINAEFGINSQSGLGTKILVRWKRED